VIRILLVEPMSLLRCSLGTVLSTEDDLDVAAELARMDEAILMTKAVRPDLAVIEIDAFNDETSDVAYELDRALPDCATLVLADVDSHGALHAALDTHVRGFVGKDNTPQRLAR
jgi:two-component system response regulator DesR